MSRRFAKNAWRRKQTTTVDSVAEGPSPSQTDGPSAKGTPTMLLTRPRNVALLVAVVIGIVAFGLARSEPVASQDEADAQATIADAMRAGPSSLSDKATILDYE